MKIPTCLQLPDLRFVKIRSGEKRPFENEWNTRNNYGCADTNFLKWIEDGGNYGIMTGVGNLAVIDSDTFEMASGVEAMLPKTLTIKTGSGGHHSYFFCPDLDKKIVVQQHNGTGLKHYGEVQWLGQQVVGPGSLHPNGKYYEILTDTEIASVKKSEIESVLEKLMPKPLSVPKDKAESCRKDNIKITGKISDIIPVYGMRLTSEGYQGSHPIHGSETGINFCVNTSENTFYCFRCNAGGGLLQAVAMMEGMISCGEKLRGEAFKKAVQIAQDKYNISVENNRPSKNMTMDEIRQNLGSALEIFNDYRAMAWNFIDNQPLFYDTTKNWWVWNAATKAWEMVDETDIMVLLDAIFMTSKITAQSVKAQIFENLRIVGRKNAPQNSPKTWIQFKDKIIDVENGSEIAPSHDYFITNPIGHDLGEIEDTPTIDRLFTEWVGESEKQKLYEIVAYCMLPNYPIHRLFCLIGSGRNGKGSFLNLVEKFIGIKNVTSTDLDRIINSRFEAAKLYKKLVAVVGETDFSILQSTRTIKRLTGGDLISGEFKNKNPFDFYNYAKIIIATNSLPITEDKTAGFYSRWIIIDFPNRFSDGKDVVKTIPEAEFRNLAKKCTRILKEILARGSFMNEGSIEEREKKYENKSNPLMLFIEKTCSREDINSDIPLFEFYDKYVIFLEENKYRMQSKKEVSSMLESCSLETYSKNVKKNDGSDTKWVFVKGVRWKESKISSLDKYPVSGLVKDGALTMAVIRFLISEFGEACEKEIESRCQNDYGWEKEKTCSILQKLAAEGRIFEKQPSKWLEV